MRQRPFKVGDQVHVGKTSTVFYRISAIDPNGHGCLIREDKLTADGRPYADQRFDTSLLRHAVTDEMRAAFLFPRQ